MDREEAIKILQEEIDGNLELTLREWQERDEQRLFPALRTAIEALSQPNYETDTEVRLAVTNRKKEKVILWDAYGEVEYYPIEALSAEDEQGVGRYEKAMQKLRDMPRYLNGVKEKQITKISTNYTTEKPNGVVEQKNDVVAEPTDLISRAELLDRIKAVNSIPWGDERGNAVKLVWSTEEVKRLVEKAPSAEQVTSKLKNPCDSLLKDDSEDSKEQKSKLDLISMGDLISDLEEWKKNPNNDDSAVDLVNHFIGIIKAAPSADRPSGEWVEKEVMVDEDTSITEWQSAKCSVCGKYHTTPYMYYFDSFNYCPNCGAKMGGKEG